jgi:DNA segregation ATPase FtsK/SpoIIIE-like protein
LVKANFPVRLVGRVVSAEDARVAAGVGGTGAEKLTGRGDFVAIYGPGLIRFQAAYVAAGEIEASVQQLAQGIRGDEIIQSGKLLTPRSTGRASQFTSLLDSAIYALPGVER